MKALLALNESTTAEILADLLQIDPEQAQAIAGQMRLSEILSLVQELKSNNTLEATEILKPYLAELGSGNKNVDSRAKQPPKTVPAPGTGASGPPGRNYPQQAGSNNVSSSTTAAQRPNISGPETPPGEQAPNYTMDIKKDGQQIASSNVGPDGAARALRTGPKSSGKGQGLSALRLAKGIA
jgi:hypothetical protein